MPAKGQRKQVECGHADRTHHALGKCRPCYQRDYDAEHGKKRFLTVAPVTPATCHPERRALVKGKHQGMCGLCAIKAARQRHGPYTRRVIGTCACGADAIYGARSGEPRCVNCYANWRWKRGGLLRRKLAQSGRPQTEG